MLHEDGRADECGNAADDAAPFRLASQAGSAAGLREERQRSGDVVGYVEQACQSPQRRTVGCIGHTGEGGGVLAYLREAARVGRNGNCVAMTTENTMITGPTIPMTSTMRLNPKKFVTKTSAHMPAEPTQLGSPKY